MVSNTIIEKLIHNYKGYKGRGREHVWGVHACTWGRRSCVGAAHALHFGALGTHSGKG